MAPLSLPMAVAGVSILGLGAAAASAQAFPAFDEYLATHGLEYLSTWGDKDARKATYDAAIQKMQKHNSNPANTWKMGLNHFTVMPKDELSTSFGYVKNIDDLLTRDFDGKKRYNVSGLPKDKDWRNQLPTVATPVKNQGSCGSCWAFDATAVMETRIALDTSYLYELSTQQITSCTPNPNKCGGTGGCAGATGPLAFEYAKKSGLSSVWGWPYMSGLTHQNGECSELQGSKAPRAGIKSYKQLPLNNADALLVAVNYNPVVVSVAASDWFSYASGVFDGCDENPVINHAVALMGYGQDPALGYYWLIRNSWGERWGEHGFIRLKRYPDKEPCGQDTEPLDGNACQNDPPASIEVCGMCGVLSDSSYPEDGYLGTPEHPEDPAVSTTRAAIVEEFSVSRHRRGLDQISAASQMPFALAAAAAATLLAAGLLATGLRRHGRRGSYVEVEAGLVDAAGA